MNDEGMRRLLGDAVSNIDPHDRIDELRASVRPSTRVVPMARHRSWYAAAGILATAAVIGVIAYLTSVAGDPGSELGPASGDGSGPTAIATDPAASQPPTRGGAGPRPLTVYYLGRGSAGELLFPRSTAAQPGATALSTAVSRLSLDPLDGDVRAAWQPGWLVSARLADGLITVELGTAPVDRPARMSARTAFEAVQAAVYTLQAAARSHAPVQFVRDGRTTASVLGVPAAQPLSAEHAWDVVAPVAILRPAVGRRHVRPGPLLVTGIATAPGGDTVTVTLSRGTTGHGRVVVQRRVGVAAPPRVGGVAAWRITLDTSDLTSGAYTVRASSSAVPGSERDADTRVVVVD